MIQAKPRSLTHWASDLKPDREELGTDALPVITLHGLRHTHAAVLLEVQENPTVVPKRFGHTTFTTTMDIYSHVTPTM